MVAPAPIGDKDVRELIGAAAGHYVSEHLPRAGTLGITCGETIRVAAQIADAVPTTDVALSCYAPGWRKVLPSIPMTILR